MSAEAIKQLGEKIKEKLTALEADQKKSVSKEDFAAHNATISKKLEELDKMFGLLGAELKKHNIGLPGLEAEKRSFSFCQVVKGLALNDWGDGYELEILKEATKAAGGEGIAKAGLVDSTTTTTGGYVIPSQLTGPIIEVLREELILQRLGVRTITATQSPIPMVRQTGRATAFWEGENTQLQLTKAAFTPFNMTPHRVGAYTQVSDRFLRFALAGAEELIRTDLMTGLAEKIDITAFIGDPVGTGNTNIPAGLFNMVGIPSITLGPDGNTGGDFTLAEAMLFEAALEDRQALRGNLGYVFNTKVRRFLMAERIKQYSGDTKGDYVMLPRTEAGLRSLLGYNYVAHTGIPANFSKGSSGAVLTAAAFGNWLDFLLVFFNNMTIAASNQASDGTTNAFLQSLVFIKVEAEVDFNVRRLESFVVAKDLVNPTTVG